MTETLFVIALLILTGLAGGFVVERLQKAENEQVIKLLLAFSGGFLLAIAFIHFIPELYEGIGVKAGVFILIGFLIQLILEFFSGGIEHGHIHVHKQARMPFGIILALCLHEVVEGIPLGSQLQGVETATAHHHGDDHSLLLGILFHRLPVAIALMTLLIRSKVGRSRAWGGVLIFSIAAPTGVLLGSLFSKSLPLAELNLALAIVVGMFLHISTTIIFETSENHKFNFVKLLTILSGCSLAFMIH